MPFFSSDVRALAAQGVLRAAILVEFDFGDDGGLSRYWAGGFGPLKTADGHIWDGTGALGKVEGLGQPIGTNAPPVVFTLSGVNARVAALAKSQSSYIKGRDCTVYIQVFGADFSHLLDLAVVWSGVMDRMTYKAQGEGVYTVSLSAESIWTGRSKPPFGEYTDTDQQKRSPGDIGLSDVPALINKTIFWP